MRQETPKLGYKVGKNPTILSLIELDQNEISKTNSTTKISSQTLLQVPSNSQIQRWPNFSKSG